MVLNIDFKRLFENCGKRINNIVSITGFYIERFFDPELHEKFWEEIGPI